METEAEPLLAGLLAAGRAAWPGLGLADAAFACHVAALAADADLQAFLLSVNYAEDLYLAGACTQGLAAALLAFEGRYLSKVAGFIPAHQATSMHVAELTQELREKFFVPRDGAAPKIAGYTGRGSLLSWVRTAAVRTHLNLLRHPAGVQVPLDDALGTGEDPELEYIKGRYREQFKAAFHDALATLTPEQRMILRIHYVEGLTPERVAPLFGVHRLTVNRRLMEAREQLQRETRRLLRERLRLSAEEFESLAGLVRSQIELSLVRGLKDD